MIEHADIQVKNYSVNARERYVCNSGFKRKAGTSTLTECVINKNTNVAHWTTPNLKCIRDPSVAQNPVPTVGTPKVTSQPESPSPSEKEARSFLSQIRYHGGHRDSYYDWFQADTIPADFCRNRQSHVLPSPISCSSDLGAYSLDFPRDNRDFSTQFQNDESELAISSSVLLVGAGVVVAFLAWYIKSRANFSAVSCCGGNHGNSANDCEGQQHGGRRPRSLTTRLQKLRETCPAESEGKTRGS
ncbi:Interleukin-15 receptor subunit alpha [Apodemus speciosus]|uniref:Interleukin-15 receptor subunit alpha n=1 Tax=Apodemus speciosus TaxID=105296 RepID=A0ABQ0EGI9_APOSI